MTAGRDRHDPAVARAATPAFALLLALAVAGAASRAEAHEVRPAYVQIREISQGTYDVTFRVPARGDDLRLGLDLELPAGCSQAGESASYLAGGAFTRRFTVACADGLDGGTIRVDGLQGTLTDALVRIEWLDRTTQVGRLLPSSPSMVARAHPGTARVAATYLGLGIEHILLGVDHLVFVLALLLLVKGGRSVLATITAFTIAHSMTLAGAALGLVHVPQAPVEATIALSIVLVAAEIVHARRGRPSLAARRPWIVAFAFGLLHGFGFAGALGEIGLPQADVVPALLCFNLGVEAGQIAFVVAMLSVAALARRVPGAAGAGARVERALPYGIGGVAMFWVIQRVAGF